MIVKTMMPAFLGAIKCFFLFKCPDLHILAVFGLYSYLFALQIKRDLLNGFLVCQEHTAILLASFIVQGKVSTVFITSHH